MWMSPKIEEAKELNGNALSKCGSCQSFPLYVHWGEPGDFQLVCPKCGKMLSTRGANARSYRAMADLWNAGMTDGLLFLENHGVG